MEKAFTRLVRGTLTLTLTLTLSHQGRGDF